MTSSRGLFPLPAGLYATARSSDRSGARPEFVSGDTAAVVDSDGGICFHRGFGVWQSAALFERLFDIVIRRKGNAGGGVLASRLLRSRRRDSDGRLRFQANRRVARGSLTGFASRHVCWELVKRSDPLDDSTKDMSESNSKPKSLILAQNERWRQA